MAKLSDFELDIMSCFWERKQLSAPDVHRLLGVERGVTYSTIKSLIDRLEAKGALSRAETPGRVIYYRAAVKQDKVRKPLVKSFLRRRSNEYFMAKSSGINSAVWSQCR